MDESAKRVSVAAALKHFFTGVLEQRAAESNAAETLDEVLYRALTADEIARCLDYAAEHCHYRLDEYEVVATWKSFTRAIELLRGGQK